MMEFITATEDISGTVLHEYVKIVAAQEAPQKYKPRSGKINTNMDKYPTFFTKNFTTRESDMLGLLGYDQVEKGNFTKLEDTGIPAWNAASLEKVLKQKEVE